MIAIWVKRRGPYLYPYDQGGTDEFARLPIEKPLRIEITQPRNPERLRLRWALIQLVAKGLHMDHEDVSDEIKIACGHYTERQYPDGSVVRRAKSISNDAMDEIAFREYHEKEIQAIYMLYGILPEDIKRELDKILAPATERRR